MVGFLRGLQRLLEIIVERVGQLGGWILFATVVLVFMNAVNRYLFEFSPMWLQEMEWHLLAGQTALGLAYAWLHRDHIAVDVFSQHYSPRMQQWLEFLTAILVAIPCSILMIDFALPYIDRSFEMLESSPNPGGLHYRFIPKSFVAIAFLLIILEAIATAIRSGFALFGPPSERVPKRDTS